MKASGKFTAAALITGAGILGASQSAQALEAHQCFTKNDQPKILQDSGQNRIAGGIQLTLLKGSDGHFQPASMKVTYTSSNDQSNGFILVENGCSPVATKISDPSSPGVYVSMPVRLTKVFDNRMNGIPLEALPYKNPDLAKAACQKIMSGRSHVPDEIDMAEEQLSEKLDEDLAHNVASPLWCSDLNSVLTKIKGQGLGVIFQATAVLENGQQGALITVAGKPDQSEGQVFLTTQDGATVPVEHFPNRIGYLDNADKFIKAEKTAALEPSVK